MKHVGVAAHISKLKTKQAKRVELSADMVLQEIMYIGFARTEDLVQITEHGVSIKDTSDQPERARAALKKIKCKRKFIDVGEEAHLVEDLEFEMHDKLKALDMLTKHLGICNPKMDLNVTDTTQKTAIQEMINSMSPAEKIAYLDKIRNSTVIEAKP